MSPLDAFLQVILDSPDDETPRLIYADWLEENGDPDRAEFIRCEVELASDAFDEARKCATCRSERLTVG